VLRLPPGTLDLHRFERLAADGSAALASGRSDEAASTLRQALGLWRGPALVDVADDSIARPEATRLDELRIAALERRIEAELACGRHGELAAELEVLVAEHPLRERLRGFQMLALYRSGRQAEALDAYRAARSTLVDELGIEPGAPLQELERAILRQDESLGDPGRRSERGPHRTLVVAALAVPGLDALLSLAEPLARHTDREVVLASTVSSAEELGTAADALRERRERLLERHLRARAAAFTSLTPGSDHARLAQEQDADLLLVDAPDGLLEDARLLALLEDAPCDVGVLVGEGLRDGPVFVPFAGAEHDWAAVELGAWLATALGVPLRLAGSTAGEQGRDASRLLANASLAVQRGLGVAADPLLVEPTPDALVQAAADAGVVVVGLTDRWRREGLGRSRTALAAATGRPTLLVRRGLRPGGLAPRESDTRFTWTIGPAG
jgi:hypothetical protein